MKPFIFTRKKKEERERLGKAGEMRAGDFRAQSISQNIPSGTGTLARSRGEGVEGVQLR